YSTRLQTAFKTSPISEREARHRRAGAFSRPGLQRDAHGGVCDGDNRRWPYSEGSEALGVVAPRYTCRDGCQTEVVEYYVELRHGRRRAHTHVTLAPRRG